MMIMTATPRQLSRHHERALRHGMDAYFGGDTAKGMLEAPSLLSAGRLRVGHFPQGRGQRKSGCKFTSA